MKKIYTLFILTLVLPISVYASWWNPTTWKIFVKQDKQIVQKTQEVGTVKQSDPVAVQVESNLLSCNGSKYNKCPEGQTFVCPTSGEDAFCDKIKTEEVKTPKTKEVSTKKIQIKQDSKTVVIAPQEKKVEAKKDENFNFLVISGMDLVIRNFERYINHFKSVNNDLFIVRENEDIEKIASINSDLSSATEVEFAEVLRFLLKSRTEELDYIRSLRSVNDQNISTLEKMLASVKEQKEIKLNLAYSREDGIKEAKEWNIFVDKLDPYMESNSKMVDSFSAVINKNDELQLEAVNTYRKNSSAIISNLKAELRDLDNQRKAIEQTDALVKALPKIDLPKMPTTTYCESRYSGIHGNYNITCTERSY